MKNFLLGIVYTVVVAGCLAHFSGCDMPEIPELSQITEYLNSDLQTAATPTPVATPGVSENAANNTEAKDEFNTVPTDDHGWTTASINVRKGPGTDYDKVGVLSADSPVHRLGICDNGWFKIEFEDTVAYISGKYYTTEAPAGAVASGPTSAPTPKSKDNNDQSGDAAPTSAATPGNTAVPTPGSSDEGNIDNVDRVLARMTSVAREVDTVSAADFYYETEKTASAAFVKMASEYTTFSILYKDKSCMHTPEYFLKHYPEFHTVKIDYDKSIAYKNAIYVVFNVSLKEGGQYAYAIRTGNTAFLKEKEKYALKEIMKISDKMDLSKKTPIDAVLTVHDYLVNNTRYSDPASYDASGSAKYSENAHSPYGLITEKSAVCDGYAESFMIFMLLNDIECNTVTGTVRKTVTRDGRDVVLSEAHAWNQVCLDGKWYNIDVTWDDPVSYDDSGNRADVVRYTYFMINDKVLYESHTPECGYEEECTSDKYHLFMYRQYMCETDDDVKAQINRQINNDSIYFVYKSGDFTKEKIIDIFQDIYNVALKSYSPIEIRSGYMMYEIINPVK